ncbi:MAG TPA: adenosine deaminase [Clostridia bacterium]|nr:adenosine deaminase [Clostridia bacterium]
MLSNSAVPHTPISDHVKPSDFILNLPKAELHLHLEGSVNAETLAELSRKHNSEFPWQNNRYTPSPDSHRELTVEDARQLYLYKDFTGFLMAFKAVTERMRDADDYELVTYEMMRKLAAERVLHAEVFVSVGVVFWRGQDFNALFEGMERGRARGEKDFGVSILWIFDAVRHFGPDEGSRVVDKAVQFRERNVVGIGIGGDERMAGPELFDEVYAHAAENSLRLTAHAGETVGPQSIWAALDVLRAERIGHALHAWQDEELMQRLVRDQVPLEICISSNLRTGCCLSTRSHPVRRYMDAGAMVTLNTDDPEMFGTSLAREYQFAQNEFGFTDGQLRAIAQNSFRASFLPEEKKREFLQLF